MNDTISREAAIDAIFSEPLYESGMKKRNADAVVPAIYEKIKSLPSEQPEPSTEIQEILDYLDNTLHPIISPDNWNVYSELHDMVSKLPSAQQWIPCSERQPEETNLYWVTVKPIDSEMLEVTPRWYFGRGYGDGWESELYEPPLAWMPMEWPEPWRGEEDEAD